MSMVYVGQDKLRIRRTANTDITGALGLAIQYRKPNGVRGSWTATSSNDATGQIYYDVASTSILDVAGEWDTWAYVTFSDGKVAYGEVVVMSVGIPGDD